MTLEPEIAHRQLVDDNFRVMPRPKKSVGRPKATTSAETRRRILVAARKCFAASGYEKTTNKDIATDAGITTGAIYHYFDSKQDLFAAVSEETTRFITEQFAEAAETEDTLVPQLRAILHKAVELHQADRSLANFATIAPVEIGRHEEVRRALRPGGNTTYQLWQRLVHDAKRRGEIAPGVSETAVCNVIAAATMGLATLGALAADVEIHREATETFERLIEGSLFTDTAAAPSQDRRRRSRRTTPSAAAI